MKIAISNSILVVALALGGCATSKPPQDISGIWDWKCCNGEYIGKMELRESSDGHVVGRMYDTSGGGKGRLEGSATDNHVEFTRRGRKRFTQHYVLELSPDGRK